MRRRALVFLSAAPLVIAPADWARDRERSATIEKAGDGVPHFGGLATTTVVEAYYPTEPGVGLVVTRYSAAGAQDRNAAAAAMIAEFESWPAGSGITDVARARQVGANQLEGTRSGRDASAGMRYAARLVIAADGTSIAAVIGECMEREDAKPEDVAKCRTALTTLDPGLGLEQRVALVLPGGAPAPAVAPPSLPTDGSGLKIEPPRIGDRPKLAPIAVAPAKQETDRRVLYIGLGLVVLAAAVWWNRKNREKFEPEGDRDD